MLIMKNQQRRSIKKSASAVILFIEKRQGTSEMDTRTGTPTRELRRSGELFTLHRSG
jgi:hypothetical protein